MLLLCSLSWFSPSFVWFYRVLRPAKRGRPLISPLPFHHSFFSHRFRILSLSIFFAVGFFVLSFLGNAHLQRLPPTFTEFLSAPSKDLQECDSSSVQTWFYFMWNGFLCRFLFPIRLHFSTPMFSLQLLHSHSAVALLRSNRSSHCRRDKIGCSHWSKTTTAASANNRFAPPHTFTKFALVGAEEGAHSSPATKGQQKKIEEEEPKEKTR